MLLPGKGMAVNVEYTTSPVTVLTVSGAETTLIGYMDYTVVFSASNLTRELCHTYSLVRLITFRLQNIS